jgi:hypothetical protein
MPDEGEEDREEYYLETIRNIVDQQKEALGEEAAIKWARRAPLKINQDGEVVGFYGKGEQALETLRNYTEHEEFYLEAIQDTINTFSTFLGEDIGYGVARKAPIQLTPDGEVMAYYGTGRQALEILAEGYEDYMGKSVADSKMKSAFSDVDDEKLDLLPEDIRPDTSESSESLLSKIKNIV